LLGGASSDRGDGGAGRLRNSGPNSAAISILATPTSDGSGHCVPRGCVTGKLEIASVLSRVVDVLIELETGPTAPAVGPGAQRQHVTVLDAALRLALSSKRRPTIPSTRTVTVHVAAHPATTLGLAQPRPDRATPGHEETDMCTVNGRPLPARASAARPTATRTTESSQCLAAGTAGVLPRRSRW